MARPDQTFHLREAGEKAFGYAQAVRAGNVLHISGTLAVNDAFETVGAGDMRAQLEAIYTALGQTLAAHGAGFAEVVKETVYVTDMDAFIAANQVRLDAYANCAPPACTAVEVRRLAFPDNLAEIEATAVLGTAS